jgi:hypothetical protein
MLGSEVHRSHRLGSVKDVLVALAPVGVTVLPVAMQNVAVTGKDQVASVGAGLPVRARRSHREQVVLTSMHIGTVSEPTRLAPSAAMSPSAGFLNDLPRSATLSESRTTHVLLSVVHPSVRHICWGSGDVAEARS